MNRSEARAVVDVLAAAWPAVEMTGDALRLWLRMLGDFDPAAGLAAAESIVRQDKFFPTVARFREALASSVREQRWEWAAASSCPMCQGTTFVRDGQGREWLCRCASFERRPRVRSAATAPPPELLAAARAVLPQEF